MFTGIITSIGVVRSLLPGADLGIRVDCDFAPVPEGASVACDGVCLTVVKSDHGGFSVDASQETLSRTTIGSW